MPSVDPHSNSTTASQVGIYALLVVVIGCIGAGTIFGIVRMQQTMEGSYQRADAVADAIARSTPAPAPIAIVGNVAHGKELFSMSCFVCHGPTGAGMPTLGPAINQSKFVRTHTDAELSAFIKIGRQPGDPNSIMQGLMPPKGGNPMLDDAGIQDVIGFVRTLQVGAAVTAPPAPPLADAPKASASSLH